jgi:hypothetical protein
MTLSDGCAQFADEVIAAAGRPAMCVEEFNTPPYSYESEEITTLRAACAEVTAAGESSNWDFDRLQRAVMRLLRLAEYTWNRHDGAPYLPPYDLPIEV